MITLGELPALRLLPPAAMTAVAPDPGAAGFAGARPVHAAAAPAAARAAAAEAGSDFVVVIDADIRATREAEALMPERALVEARLCLGFPSRSLVTGLAVARGLRLIPVDRLRDEDEALPAPALIVPRGIGHYAANDSPQRAFHAGFACAAAQPLPPPGSDAARNRLALAASLGADALNGVWWVLGALSGLAGRDGPQAAWAEVAPLLADQAAPPRRVRELARLVRLETGLPVRALDRRQSRAIKAMLSDWAPPEMWRDFIEGLADLGADGSALADRYRQAAAQVWSGEM